MYQIPSLIKALPDIWFEFLVYSREGATTWQTRRQTRDQAEDRWLRAKLNQDEHQPITLWSHYIGLKGFRRRRRSESKARASREIEQEITRFKRVRSNRKEQSPVNHIVERLNRTAREAREINRTLTLVFADLSRLLWSSTKWFR